MEWKPYFVNDSLAGAAGSDAIAVPDGRVLRISGVRIKLVASDSVGNRLPVVRVTDSDGDIVMETRAGAVTAASATRYFNFSPSLSNMAAFVDTDHITNTLPDIWIQQGCNLVILDQAGIDPGSDAMEIAVFGEIADYRY